MNVLLAPTRMLDSMTSSIFDSNEYVRAQRDGRVRDDCSVYRQNCAFSFFEVRKDLFLNNFER